jgi:surface protein
MREMFSGATSFNQDIGSWNVSSLRTYSWGSYGMKWMFKGAESFNQDISSWDVGLVNEIDMSGIFWGATAFNQDISAWDVSKVTFMNDIFSYSALSTDNYDRLLNNWSELIIIQNIEFGAQGINYCNGADARQRLIDDFGWTITDGGLDCATAGVEDENLLTISIYPNPVKDKLNIQGLSSPTKVSIYNVLGKLVLSETTTSEIDIEGLQSGIYIVKIIDQQKETTRKFIKN